MSRKKANVSIYTNRQTRTQSRAMLTQERLNRNNTHHRHRTKHGSHPLMQRYTKQRWTLTAQLRLEGKLENSRTSEGRPQSTCLQGSPVRICINTLSPSLCTHISDFLFTFSCWSRHTVFMSFSSSHGFLQVICSGPWRGEIFLSEIALKQKRWKKQRVQTRSPKKPLIRTGVA